MLLALVTLVLAQLEPAPEGEREASRAWTDCLSAQAARLDDGTSDAGAVAQGVATACVSEFLRMRDVYGRGADPATFADLTARLERGVNGQAIRAVLEGRKRSRDDARVRPPPPQQAAPEEAPQEPPQQEPPQQEPPGAPPPEEPQPPTGAPPLEQPEQLPPDQPPPDAPVPTQP